MGYNSPKEILTQIRSAALQKSAPDVKRLFTLGILGGAYIAFGSILATIVGSGYADNPGLGKFLFGAVFPVGLILVVIAGAELFTSSCAIMPVSVMSKDQSINKLFKVWGLGYLGNFVGAIIVVYLFVYLGGVINAEVFSSKAIAVAVGKTSNPFYKTFVKGIGANWLVCLAVWQAYAAKDVTGKILAMWFPVMTFVTMGFEHSIANMYFIPAGMALGADISWSTFIINNLIPATLGNIVGGFLFVGTAYWYIYVSKDLKQEKVEVKEAMSLQD